MLSSLRYVSLLTIKQVQRSHARGLSWNAAHPHRSVVAILIRYSQERTASHATHLKHQVQPSAWATGQTSVECPSFRVSRRNCPVGRPIVGCGCAKRMSSLRVENVFRDPEENVFRVREENAFRCGAWAFSVIRCLGAVYSIKTINS